jgi:transglutaminase-like putative cysteine protease
VIFSIFHTTIYRFGRPVRLGEHRMMLRPLSGSGQTFQAETVRISPEPSELRWEHDSFGNHVGVTTFGQPARELSFDYSASVQHTGSGSEPSEGAQARGTEVFLSRRHLDDEAQVSRCLDRFAGDGPIDKEGLARIAKGIRRDFTYIRRTESGIQTPGATIARASGTCRDFAVLLIEMMRSRGIPARFVSGYLYVPSRDRPDIRGGGATHAWAQVLLPGEGWIDVDPTNGQLGNAGLIRVAVVAEPSEGVPLSGTYFGDPKDSLGMTVTVKIVRRSAEKARKPDDAN